MQPRQSDLERADRGRGRLRAGAGKGERMIIHSKDLTADEFTDISARYGPYDNCEEFWAGFAGYQQNRCCPKDWAEDSIAGEAWSRGSEAAARCHWERYRCPYARDVLDTFKMCRGLEAAIERMKREGTLPKPYRRRNVTAPANDN